MDRRGFLKTIGLVAPAVILTPGLLMPVRSIFVPPLILFGDGLHDDTSALQGLINGRVVTWADGTPATTLLRGGSYLITRTLHIGKSTTLSAQNARFIGKLQNEESPMIYVSAPDTDRVLPLINNCYFERGTVASSID